MLAGLYTTPAIHVRVRCYFTNTLPVDAYRGAGRPEAAYLVERLVDECAKATGIARDEIRRRNFAPAAAMPLHHRARRDLRFRRLHPPPRQGAG